MIVDDESELRRIIDEAQSIGGEQLDFTVPEVVGRSVGADWRGRSGDATMLGRTMLAKHSVGLEVEQRTEAIAIVGPRTGSQLFGSRWICNGFTVGRSLGHSMDGFGG